MNDKSNLRVANGLLVAGLLVFLVGCELLESRPATHARLIGEWEWLQSTGGIAGWTITPDSTGYGPQRLVFDSRRATLYRADTLAWNAPYTLERDEGAWLLHYQRGDTRFMADQQLRFQGADTLVLADRCDDCYISTYRRIGWRR